VSIRSAQSFQPHTSTIRSYRSDEIVDSAFVEAATLRASRERRRFLTGGPMGIFLCY